jgi:hypothetical protein
MAYLTDPTPRSRVTALESSTAERMQWLRTVVGRVARITKRATKLGSTGKKIGVFPADEDMDHLAGGLARLGLVDGDQMKLGVTLESLGSRHADDACGGRRCGVLLDLHYLEVCCKEFSLRTAWEPMALETGLLKHDADGNADFGGGMSTDGSVGSRIDTIVVRHAADSDVSGSLRPNHSEQAKLKLQRRLETHGYRLRLSPNKTGAGGRPFFLCFFYPLICLHDCPAKVCQVGRTALGVLPIAVSTCSLYFTLLESWKARRSKV